MRILLILLPLMLAAGARPAVAQDDLRGAYVCPVRAYISPYCDCVGACECAYDGCLRRCPIDADGIFDPCIQQCHSDDSDCVDTCVTQYGGGEYCGEFG